MASILNATTTSGLVTSADNSGLLQLQTNNGTTAVTVDTSQNVLVGTTSSSYYKTNFVVNSASSTGISVIDTSATLGMIAFGTGTNAALGGSSNRGKFWYDLAADSFNWNTAGSGSLTAQMTLTSGGNFTITGATATKASGTTWANPSDIRLKENITDFTKGLSELEKVNVKTWKYNGKGGTIAGTKGLGVIADEIMQVLPETVDTYKAKLNKDDAEESDIKRFDATEITWLLVNAVKELKAELDATKAEVKALKGVA